MNKTFILLLTLLFFITQCSATSSKRSFGEVVDDNIILIKLKSKFVKDQVVKSSQIKAKVWKGVVSLSGVLDRQEQINRAIEITEQQRGVKEVRAYMVLKVHQDSMTVKNTNKNKSVWSFLSKDKGKRRDKKTTPDPHIQEANITEDGKVITNSQSTDQNTPQDVKTNTNNPQVEETADFKEFEY